MRATTTVTGVTVITATSAIAGMAIATTTTGATTTTTRPAGRQRLPAGRRAGTAIPGAVPALAFAGKPPCWVRRQVNVPIPLLTVRAYHRALCRVPIRRVFPFLPPFRRQLLEGGTTFDAPASACPDACR